MKQLVLFLSIFISYQLALANKPEAKPAYTVPTLILAPDMDAAERGAIYKIQAELEGIMPQHLFLSLVKNRPSNGYRLALNNLSEHVAGNSSRSGLIVINRKLLKSPELLKKTLIHEWAHQYDFINVHTAKVNGLISDCYHEAMKDKKSISSQCVMYSKVKTSVSTLPEFLEVGGWFLKTNGKGFRKSDTGFSMRSLDVYELSSPAEMFAVNMEYFVTDPEFQCRKPTMYRFLKTYFRQAPFAERDCSGFLKIVNPSFLTLNRSIVSIDASRLYQVHYLLASRGSSISSKFGHSMFRLVMCAPSRKVVGPDCLEDIQYHLALSFRAFVNTPEISNLAGLAGSYPSRLFFVPFSQVVEEYTKDDLRDLESYPLNFRAKERQQFLERSIEMHWEYNGKYYFVSNNCAVESMNLIRSSSLRSSLMDEVIVTPYGLKDKLVNARILQEDVLEDRDLAAKKGYLFVSHREFLEKALDGIFNATGESAAESLDEWMELSPLQRKSIFVKYTPQNKKDKMKYAAAFVLLESRAEKDSENSIQDYIFQLLKEENLDAGIAEVLRKIMELQSGFVDLKGELVTPGSMLKVGYGLPSEVEIASLMTKLEVIAQKKSASKGILQDLYARIFKPEQVTTVNQVRKNKELFIQTLMGAMSK